ncbi:MAG: HAMP domain-containing protein [Desulfobacteraceae bacterium]|nr:HAMP domain-containing protein [Desulfobacteraceae bacterium]
MKNSLSVKINIIIVLVVAAIFVIFGCYEVFQTRSKVYNDLNLSLSIISERLASTLAAPLWTMDDESINLFVIPEMRDKNVCAVIVRNAFQKNNIVLAKVRNKEWELHDAAPSDLVMHDSYIHKTLPIIKDDENLGSVEVHLTNNFINEQITEYITIRAITLLLLLIGVVVTLATVITSSVSRPVRALIKTFESIAGGNLNQEIETFRADEIGRLAKSFATMRDAIQEKIAALHSEIEERKRTEAERARLTTILETTSDLVAMSTPDTKLIYMNSTGRKMVGWKDDEDIAAKKIPDIHPEWVLSIIRKKGIPTAIEKGLWEGETAFIGPDGNEIPVSQVIMSHKSPGGKLEYLSTIMRDITERLRAEKVADEAKRLTHEMELAKKMQAVQERLIQSEKLAAMGNLIAGVSHEINTPVGAIKASVGIIEDSLLRIFDHLPRLFQIISEDQQKNFFVLIRKSSESGAVLSSKEERRLRKNLSAILEELELENADSIADTLTDIGIYDEIENFLPLLRHPENQLILETAYDLSSLVRSAQNITVATERAAKVTFALKSYAHFDRGGEMIRSELSQGIETVLTLYHNQLKQGVEVIRNYEKFQPVPCFPDELNQVWTNIIHNAIQAMDGKGKLEIDVHQKEGYAVVTFVDTGKGIPEEIRDKIFDPFFTTKSAGEGSGLGLHIVKKIIDKHNGEIRVESESGKTVFSFFIPVIKRP